MGTTIDLDAIIDEIAPDRNKAIEMNTTKQCMKESIHQALVLASENATLCTYKYDEFGEKIEHDNLGQEITEDSKSYISVYKQSILDVELLIK